MTLKANKRKSERYPRHNPAVVVIMAPAGDALPLHMEGRLDDASAQGLSLPIPVVPEIGSAVMVKVELQPVGVVSNRLQYFESEGVIQWARPAPPTGLCRVGIRFRNTPKVELEKWRLFLSQWKPLSL